jgi:hypothetical protein
VAQRKLIDIVVNSNHGTWNEIVRAFVRALWDKREVLEMLSKNGDLCSQS